MSSMRVVLLELPDRPTINNLPSFSRSFLISAINVSRLNSRPAFIEGKSNVNPFFQLSKSFSGGLLNRRVVQVVDRFTFRLCWFRFQRSRTFIMNVNFLHGSNRYNC